MDGTGSQFDAFIAALGDACTVTVVRYPPNTALGYRALEDIARACLPTTEPYVILGESFSGPIAVSLAASAGPLLKGLILCASFVKNPRPMLGGLRPLLGLVPLATPPSVLLDPVLFGPFGNPRLRAQLAHALAQVAPHAMRARLQAVLEVDVSNRLRAVAVPMLYLQAQQDRLVLASAGSLIRRLRPDIHFVQIDAPHLVLQAVPEESSRIVLEFLLRIELNHGP
jgi:pimeloyl-ACP methyl ester carboxylesterase